MWFKFNMIHVWSIFNSQPHFKQLTPPSRPVRAKSTWSFRLGGVNVDYYTTKLKHASLAEWTCWLHISTISGDSAVNVNRYMSLINTMLDVLMLNSKKSSLHITLPSPRQHSLQVTFVNFKAIQSDRNECMQGFYAIFNYNVACIIYWVVT